MLKFGNVDSLVHALFYCLNAELSVTTVYLPFKAKCPDTKVKSSFCSKFFRKSFSDGFRKPQIQSCVTFELLKNTVKSKTVLWKMVAEADLSVRKRRAEKSRYIFTVLT